MGLLPFAGLTLSLFFVAPEIVSLLQFAFLSYAAVILTFIGGVHWGLIIKGDDFDNKVPGIIVSIVPSLVAWTCLLLPQAAALVVLLCSFPLLLIYEYKLLWTRLFPSWYQGLRIVLTSIVSLLLAVNLVFIL